MGHLTIEEEFTQLGLTSTELLALGLVHGFSQGKQGVFFGSREYIRRWLCVQSLRTVDKTMQTLVDRGLIEKSECFEGGVRRCAYKFIEAATPANFAGSANSAQHPCNNCTDTSANSAHKNTIESPIESPNTPTTRVKLAEYVSMTAEEYQKLVDKYGDADAKRMIEILDNYKGQSGKKYESDYRACLGWVADKLEEEKRKRLQSASSRGAFVPGPRFNNRGETPTVASMRAAAESFQRIADRHAASDIPTGVDFIPAPAYEEPQIDDQL